MTEFVGAEEWRRFAVRVGKTPSPWERLALCGDMLHRHHSRLQPVLDAPAWGIVDDVDPSIDRSDDELAAALLAPDDGSKAIALLEMATILDRRNAAPRALAQHWGPFPALVGEGELWLLRVPRGGKASPDTRQNLVSQAIANHRVLQDAPGGLTWDIGALAPGPGGRVLRGLLGRHRWPLKIALWPGIDARMSSFTVTGRCVAVSPRSEDIPTLVDDVRDAVAFAEQQHAAVLVLPELYLPEGALKEIQDLLGLVGRGSYPALTILGLAHQAVEEMWRNEAVVLDYTGRELWRYRKVAPFVTPQGIGECLKTGDRIILRSTPAGWFTTVICVDLFAVTPHQALEMAAPSLVLVPSLSPSTTAHLKAAVEVKVRGSACVVANRPLDVRRAVAPSFHTFGRDAVLLPDPSVADWAPAGHVG